MNLALVGKNIGHSKSSEMYEELLDHSINYYLLDYDCADDILNLNEIFLKYDLSGLSITAPYKKHFIQNVTIEDKDTLEIGAINCIKKENNKYLGINTDLLACREIIKKEFTHNYKNYVMFGSGSMAKMTNLIFSQANKDITCFSRKEHGELNVLNLEYFGQDTLFINAASRDFVFRGLLPKGCTFWDYNYNNTKQSDKLSSLVNYKDGLGLLRLQARYALNFWNN